ncbi:Uncharacterised protein [Prevotella melaninogenica]|nr:Uncharacterised protein [Prevotella melaninogenica]
MRSSLTEKLGYFFYPFNLVGCKLMSNFVRYMEMDDKNRN